MSCRRQLLLRRWACPWVLSMSVSVYLSLSICLCLSVSVSVSASPSPSFHISTGVHVCGRIHSHAHAYTPKAVMSVAPDTAMGAGRTSKGMCVTARPPSLC